MGQLNKKINSMLTIVLLMFANPLLALSDLNTSDDGLLPSASVQSAEDSDTHPMDWVPIPWSTPQEFPWEGVGGTWTAFKAQGIKQKNLIFTFKVTKTSSNLGNILLMKIIDPVKCHVVAVGRGIENIEGVGSVVRGHLTTINNLLSGKKSETLSVAMGSFDQPGREVGLFRDGVVAISLNRLGTQKKSSLPILEIQIEKHSDKNIVSSLCNSER